MNIYDYIDSPDVAAHCRKVGYAFDPIEMAVLINESRKTIEQKHAAYRALMDEYPDMSFHESVPFGKKYTLHTFLEALIEYEEKAIRDFMDPKLHRKTRYTVSSYSLRQLGLKQQETYDVIQEAINAVKTEEKQKEYRTAEEVLDEIRPIWDRDNVRDVRIMKRWGKYRFEALDITYDGEHTYVDMDEKHAPGSLGDIFIHIPVPFENGDIVYDGEEPCVLKSVPDAREDYRRRVPGSFKGNDDVFLDCAFYYYLCDGGIGDSGHHPVPYPSTGRPIRKCKYFREELTGEQRVLTRLSEFIKEHDGDPGAAAIQAKAAELSEEYKHFKIRDGKLVKYIEARGITKATVPQSVTSIGANAFFCCDGLASVTIPHTVTDIEEGAFSECGNISIIAPKGSYAAHYAKEHGIEYREL